MKIQPDRKPATPPPPPPTAPKAKAEARPEPPVRRETAPLNPARQGAGTGRQVQTSRLDLPDPGGLLDWAVNASRDGLAAAASETARAVQANAEKVQAAVEAVVPPNVDAADVALAAAGPLVQAHVTAAETLLDTAQDVFSDIVVPAYDASILGARGYSDRGLGPLGPVLTERLDVGEAVSMKIEAGVTLPTEFTGAPNLKLDRGGTLTIRRVEARDEHDRPILDPTTGQPATRLEVKLQSEERIGGAYSAEAGVNAAITMGNQRVGLTAKASAEAEMGVQGAMTLTMRLDPDDPASGATLSGVLNSVTKASGLSSMPGLSQAMEQVLPGSGTPPDLVLFESVEFDGGLYTTASGEASLEAGVREADPATQGLIQRLDPDAGKGLFGMLKLTLAAVSASAGGSVNVKAAFNGRTGEQTIRFDVAGSTRAGATLVNQGRDVKVEASRSIDLILKGGELQGVNVKLTVTQAEFRAMRNSVEDVYGRPLDEGFLADASTEDTVSLTMAVRPEVVAIVKEKLASGDPQAINEAMQTLVNVGLRRSEVALEPGSIKRTRRNEFQMGLGLGAALLGKVESRSGVTFGHEQQVQT